jgi:hypothetical protein
VPASKCSLQVSPSSETLLEEGGLPETEDDLHESFAPRSSCHPVRLYRSACAKRDDSVGPRPNVSAGHTRLERCQWIKQWHWYFAGCDRDRSRRLEPRATFELQRERVRSLFGNVFRHNRIERTGHGFDVNNHGLDL